MLGWIFEKLFFLGTVFWMVRMTIALCYIYFEKKELLGIQE